MAPIDPDQLAAAKQVLRDAIRQRRAHMTHAECATADRARTTSALGMLGSEPVALYASIPPEPDTHALLAALLDRGTSVLLPVLSPLGPGRPRHDIAWAWCRHVDDLRPGLWGIPEPTGEVLDASALAQADLVLVPGLAAGRDGTRLGTGGGWYDRALLHRREGVPVWMLVDEADVFTSVPVGALDQRVTGLITDLGLVRAG